MAAVGIVSGLYSVGRGVRVHEKVGKAQSTVQQILERAGQCSHEYFIMAPRDIEAKLIRQASTFIGKEIPCFIVWLNNSAHGKNLTVSYYNHKMVVHEEYTYNHKTDAFQIELDPEAQEMLEEGYAQTRGRNYLCLSPRHNPAIYSRRV